MKTDRSYWDQIDDYLHGRLSPEEEQAMEQAIQADADLKEEVQLQEKIVKGLRQLRLEALTEQAKAWEAEISKENKERSIPDIQPNNPGKTTQLRPWMWAAAAAAILIIATIFLLRQSTAADQRLAIQAFSMPEIQGTKGIGDSPYLQGLETFEEGDYPKAVQLLKLVAAADSNYITAQFLLGLCHFEQKDYTSALTNFQMAKQQDYRFKVLIGTPPDNVSVSTKHIDWYLALSYFAKGQTRPGQQILQNILQDPSHPYFSAAQTLQK